MPHPAALIKTAKKKTLVIADPHLGWELALQEKGIHVPSQTPKILKKLVALLSKYKPDVLLILGDVKYTVVASEPGEWRDIPDFFSEIKKHVAEVGIVRGNHDKACCGITDAEDFNIWARLATVWTRNELTPEHSAFLRGLPPGPVTVFRSSRLSSQWN